MLNHMSSGSALANNDLNELALDVWANFNVYRAFKSWATSRAKAANAAKAAKVVSKAAKAAMAAKEAMAAEALAAKAKAEAAEAAEAAEVLVAAEAARAAGERKAIKICVAHELLPKLKGAWARRTQKMIIEAVGFTQAMTGSEVARAAARGAGSEKAIGRRSLRRMREQEQRGQIGGTPLYSRMNTLTNAGFLRVAAGCSLRHEGST